jgi:hypothetical protein
LGAFLALRAKNRAIRSNLVCRAAAHKYFRFYPLRGRHSELRPQGGGMDGVFPLMR